MRTLISHNMKFGMGIFSLIQCLSHATGDPGSFYLSFGSAILGELPFVLRLELSWWQGGCKHHVITHNVQRPRENIFFMCLLKSKEN